MEKETWIKRRGDVELIEPIAVVGSPGLRSIGKLVMESLIAKSQATLIADLYSTHMPSCLLYTSPSPRD